MFFISQFFNRKKSSVFLNQSILKPKDRQSSDPPLIYNWIITNRLAIGPMPRSDFHWEQLEYDGFLNRFSCCYPHEHIFATIPDHWNSREVSLPDHREQDLLDKETLTLALKKAHELIVLDSSPVYLHCFAGQERSALIAIGLVSILEKKDLFESIAFVRQCHKRAKPLYSQLDLLEQVLKDYK